VRSKFAMYSRSNSELMNKSHDFGASWGNKEVNFNKGDHTRDHAFKGQHTSWQ